MVKLKTVSAAKETFDEAVGGHLRNIQEQGGRIVSLQVLDTGLPAFVAGILYDDGAHPKKTPQNRLEGAC